MTFEVIFIFHQSITNFTAANFEKSSHLCFGSGMTGLIDLGRSFFSFILLLLLLDPVALRLLFTATILPHVLLILSHKEEIDSKVCFAMSFLRRMLCCLNESNLGCRCCSSNVIDDEELEEFDRINDMKRLVYTISSKYLFFQGDTSDDCFSFVTCDLLY